MALPRHHRGQLLDPADGNVIYVALSSGAPRRKGATLIGSIREVDGGYSLTPAGDLRLLRYATCSAYCRRNDLRHVFICRRRQPWHELALRSIQGGALGGDHHACPMPTRSFSLLLGGFFFLEHLGRGDVREDICT